ncbi:MAG: hypothetical protein ACTSWU_00915 [Candidatus Thorarchaeota archaeon]
MRTVIDVESAKIISILLKEHKTAREICAELGITNHQFRGRREKLATKYDINLVYNPSNRKWSLENNQALSAEEVFIVTQLEKMGLDKKRMRAFVEAFTTQQPYRVGPKVLEFSKNKIKFLIISDTHLGSKYYRPDILRHAAEYAKYSECDFVVNLGDSIEGVSGRADQWLELDKKHGLGLSEQIDYLCDEFSQFGNLPIYSIEAQGSHGGWAYASHRGSQGLDIGRTIEAFCQIHPKKPRYIFLGFDVVDLKIKGIKIRLRHPEKLQIEDYVSRLMPNNKPHILLQGHFHGIVGYSPHRNVHCIDAGTMQMATPYLERKGAVPILGYWVIELIIGEAPSKTGQTLLNEGHYIESFKSEFIQFYD